MEELNAFEHQVADGLGVMGGPGRRIDAMAMVRTASTQSPKWRFQTMFSATKFVLAGAIVALFGGFLLSGVLTQPSEESLPAVGASASVEAETTVEATATVESVELETSIDSDLLPGVDLVVEEIEPGFLRVLSDGVRDLTANRTTKNMRFVPGQDGSMWLFKHKVFYRLGADTHEVSTNENDAGYGLGADDIEVGPDGVVWWADRGGEGLKSFDGQTWTLRRQRPAGFAGMVDEVEVLADGTVLASWRGDTSRKLARLSPDGWEVLASVDVPPIGRREQVGAVLQANDFGEVWLGLEPPRSPNVGTLYRGHYPSGVNGDLSLVELPPTDPHSVYPVDGMVWAVARGDGETEDALFRFDGTAWTEYVHPEGLPKISFLLSITADGMLTYVSSCEITFFDILGDCEFVQSDGRDASRVLPGPGFKGGRIMTVTPDGTAWLVLNGEQGGLYVITPEAVAATE